MDAQPPSSDPFPDPAASPSPAEPPAPRKLTRSREDRLVAGVAGGLGRYFGLDPILFRLALILLAFAGGAGFLLYLAAIALVPDAPASDAGTATGPGGAVGRSASIVGLVVLACIAVAIFGVFGFALGAVVFPLGVLALMGLAVWWFSSGERPGGTPIDLLRRSLVGLGVLLLCGGLAVGSFLAAGFGGGSATAAVVIVLGVALIVASTRRSVRWLVLPGLAIVLPLALVSAADIDLDGGFGQQIVRPGTERALEPSYELGAGQLVLDLRGVKLRAGDHAVHLRVGTGHALVLVDDDVCVSSTGRIGAGAAELFDHTSGGLDHTVEDPRVARSGDARLLVDADVGIGAYEVAHDADLDGDGRGYYRTYNWGNRNATGNTGCEGRA